ncbi:hypothetical protein [Legionella norrlandica]|uniref:hypothetical protein n=1 Tax=Legionella norrlandica TaxID=1498499 RepID=UPI000A4D2983|nr:hypothetical protein [Legionella norrlandica]
MAKNEQLFHVLKRAIKDTLSAPDNHDLRRGTLRILDDILKADPSDHAAFRQAIINNEFWNTRDAELMEDKADSDDFLNSRVEGEYSFKKLHQLAAEERVKLGLASSDDSVLIAILKNNPDQCRAYLASKKPELGNFSQDNVPGWVEDEHTLTIPPVAINKSTNVLPDEAMKRIKEYAQDTLLLKFINRSRNDQLLDNLCKAGNEQTLKSAANALGLPPGASGVLSFPLSDAVKGVLEERIEELRQNAAQTGFEGYVQSLSKDALLAKKAGLEGDDNTFKASLDEPYKTYLPESDLNRARGILGARYLQEALLSEKRDLLPALTAQNEEALRSLLKGLMGNHNYIDHSVTKDNLGSLKKVMLQNFINRMADPNQLKALDGAPNLGKFREALGTLRITPADWVRESDFKDIKQWVRSRHLELQVANESRLGVTAHPKLFSVFNQLPIEKQREIILNKSGQIRNVLNATEKHIAEHYLGKDAHGIDELVKENTRLAAFRDIHNAEIARILANFKPDITLSGDQVKEINSALLEIKASDHPNTFTDVGEYKSLIDKIKAQSGVVDREEFYKAFNLNSNGSDFISTAADTATKKIGSQHQCNEKLMDEYSNEKYKRYRPILAVFLKLDKPYPLDKTALSGSSNSITFSLLNKIVNSDSAKNLIDKLITPNPPNSPLTPEQMKLKDHLTREITPGLFDEMKNVARRAQFVSPKAENVTRAVNEVKAGLEGIQGSINQ